MSATSYRYLEEGLDLVLRQVDLEVFHRGRHLGHVDAPAFVRVSFFENPADVEDDFSFREVRAVLPDRDRRRKTRKRRGGGGARDG